MHTKHLLDILLLLWLYVYYAEGLGLGTGIVGIGNKGLNKWDRNLLITVRIVVGS